MGNKFGVKLFLFQLGELLAEKKVKFKPRNRNKTMAFLLDHDLTSHDAMEIVGRLEEKHVYTEPEGDRNKTPGNVMVFLYPYEEDKKAIELYVKLKIWKDESTGEHGAVLSFHEEGKHD